MFAAPVATTRKAVASSINERAHQAAARVARPIRTVVAESHLPGRFSGNQARLQLFRKCACNDEPQTLRAIRAGSADGAGEAPAIVDDVLRSAGRPLEAPVRSAMEMRFGHDFSDVRIHDDRYAVASADAVGAEAYTVGSDIVFGAGRYARSSGRERLLAHELAHVVQQRGLPVAHGVQRTYAHKRCAHPDLEAYVWPADFIARAKVKAAIGVLSASPFSNKTSWLFKKYFMTRHPDVAAILGVFRQLHASFDADGYTYVCEEQCPAAGKNAYSDAGVPVVHLCMDKTRVHTDDRNAQTIIHEFLHIYTGARDIQNCYVDESGCPRDLDPNDALANAYSFAAFAAECK